MSQDKHKLDKCIELAVVATQMLESCERISKEIYGEIPDGFEDAYAIARKVRKYAMDEALKAAIEEVKKRSGIDPRKSF